LYHVKNDVIGEAYFVNQEYYDKDPVTPGVVKYLDYSYKKEPQIPG